MNTRSASEGHSRTSGVSTDGCVVVVMGVSGTGKSTVGAALAKALDVPYLDGDHLHPRSNLQKMAAGTPLTDNDREPWLRSIAAWIGQVEGSAVVSCSALRRVYRRALRSTGRPLVFLHLVGPEEVIRQRMGGRDHFMPESLLKSQISTLEPLDPDEPGATFSVIHAVDEIVAAFLASWPYGADGNAVVRPEC